MPHIIVKIAAGRTDAQKHAIAAAMTQAIMACADVPELAVSVSIEDYEPRNWAAQVYAPDIMDKPETLYKKPGYEPDWAG